MLAMGNIEDFPGPHKSHRWPNMISTEDHISLFANLIDLAIIWVNGVTRCHAMIYKLYILAT
jgi:hypothetical protein